LFLKNLQNLRFPQNRSTQKNLRIRLSQRFLRYPVFRKNPLYQKIR
jgi:hypothetical protein